MRTSRGRAVRTGLGALVLVLVAAGCTGGDAGGDAGEEAAESPATSAEPSTPEPLPDDGDEDDAGDDVDAGDGTDGAADDAGDADGGGGGTDGEATIEVFFTNAGRGPEPQVFPVERTVAAPAVLRGALEALLAGPTSEEELEGYRSFFSAETADQLEDVTISDGVAEVSFSSELPELIPNASASTGSATLLAALDATATQFDTVDEAVYSLEGDVDAFYEWLQLASPS